MKTYTFQLKRIVTLETEIDVEAEDTISAYEQAGAIMDELRDSQFENNEEDDDQIILLTKD